MADEIRINHENKQNDGIPSVYSPHLPSTELGQPRLDWENREDIHLRDYLDVIIRRKWLIICILAMCFLTTLVFTLTSTKIYKATSTIEVTQETPQVTKFEEVVAAEYDRVAKETEDPGLKELLLRLRDHEIYHAEVFSDLLKEEK